MRKTIIGLICCATLLTSTIGGASGLEVPNPPPTSTVKGKNEQHHVVHSRKTNSAPKEDVFFLGKWYEYKETDVKKAVSVGTVSDGFMSQGNTAYSSSFRSNIRSDGKYLGSVGVSVSRDRSAQVFSSYESNLLVVHIQGFQSKLRASKKSKVELLVKTPQNEVRLAWKKPSLVANGESCSFHIENVKSAFLKPLLKANTTSYLVIPDVTGGEMFIRLPQEAIESWVEVLDTSMRKVRKENS